VFIYESVVSGALI